MHRDPRNLHPRIPPVCGCDAVTYDNECMAPRAVSGGSYGQLRSGCGIRTGENAPKVVCLDTPMRAASAAPGGTCETITRLPRRLAAGLQMR